MRFSIAIIMCTAFALSGAGQYTYFNVTNGSDNPNGPMSTSNIEVVPDGYVTWGAGSDADGYLTYYFHRFDENGQLIEAIPYQFANDFVWVGRGDSFKSFPNNSGFIMIQAKEKATGTYGFVMKLNENMDTLWTREYDLFPPFTYFFAHTVVSDGIIIAGEYGLAPGELGTFIVKIDFEGEVLWQQILHEPGDGIFRNFSILKSGENIIASGYSSISNETEGLLTITANQGQVLGEYEGIETELIGGPIVSIVDSDSNIVCAQTIGYQSYGESLWWSKIRVNRFDLVSEEFVWENEYFADFERVNGGVIMFVESLDNGFVFLGNAISQPSDDDYSYLFKIDSTGNLIWEHRYTHVSCATCLNKLHDIENTLDGGYVMAGTYSNSSENPNDKTWLVKVDACGDIEWQGCAPVGVGEWERSPSVTVFPNPTSNILNIELSSSIEVEFIEIVDLSGRVVLDASFDNGIDVSNLGTGIYLMRLLNVGRVIYSEKLIVE